MEIDLVRKIVFLLNHSPDPRIIKKIETIADIIKDVEIIFWNRFDDIFKYSGDFRTYPITIKNSSNFYLRIINSIYLIFKSLFYLFKSKPDIIYIDGIDMLMSAYIFKLLSFRKIKKKIILEIGDIPVVHYKKKHMLLSFIIEKLINLLIKKVDLLVLTSPYFWDEYYKKIYPFKENVIIIENVPEKSLFENYIPIEHEGFIIGFIGSIRYVKQLKLLFDACKGLNDIKIIIAGGGPEINKLKEIINNYENVYYLGPFDYKKDILKLYSQVDLLYAVYDTSIENVKKALPNKLYEAIVCEIPIVVARGTSLADYVKKLGVGFSVSDSDPNELRNLILYVKSNDSVIKNIKNKEKLLKERFYWENIKEELKRAVLKLL
jgi:glycosyltransferase involved in cell wall biosynthesis